MGREEKAGTSGFSQPVSNSPYRLNNGRVGGFSLKLASQAADIHIYGIALTGIVPYIIHKLFPAESLTGSLRQLEQQFHLGAGKLPGGPAVDRYLKLGDIYVKRADAESLELLGNLALFIPAKHHLYPGL